MGEGTVNDEELVEVMRLALNEMDAGLPAWTKSQVRALLGRLQSAGVFVFRPEDCEIPLPSMVDADKSVLYLRKVMDYVAATYFRDSGGSG